MKSWLWNFKQRTHCFIICFDCCRRGALSKLKQNHKCSVFYIEIEIIYSSIGIEANDVNHSEKQLKQWN